MNKVRNVSIGFFTFGRYIINEFLGKLGSEKR